MHPPPENKWDWGNQMRRAGKGGSSVAKTQNLNLNNGNPRLEEEEGGEPRQGRLEGNDQRGTCEGGCRAQESDAPG